MEPKRSPDDEPLRVLIVDDHALFRRGLQMVLASEADIDVVGEASDGAEAVDKAKALRPDVVLMDVRMPRRSGIEAASVIRDELPEAKILMLTMSDEEADLYEAIKAGASGYLLKEISIEEVPDAIRSVWAGQSRISPSMASKLLSEFAAMSQRGEGRKVKRLEEPMRLVGTYEPEYEELSDADLKGKTEEFKQRVADGESLDDVLPEAFAAVREAARRSIGQRHFDVQVLGAIALH